MIYSDDDIDRIGAGLVARTLAKAEWTHPAHFAAALWLLNQPHLDAGRDMPGLIRAYNEAVGTPNTDASGYHETITKASLACARHHLARAQGASLSAVLAALLASSYGRSDWLLAHWTRERLFSPAARRAWLAPDVSPLPFPSA